MAAPIDGLDFDRRGAVAIATLSRPARRNALGRAMQSALADWYPRLARDPGVYAAALRSGIDGVFSVGGDVREILEMAAADLAGARRGLGEELALCWQHECFSKPTVSLIDGVVMGTGVGITLYGTHRVAGPHYSFRMPETAIGYFPDCGVVHAFARMPGAIGLYLGLTGEAVGPADAYGLGLVTHCIPSARHEEILAALAEAEPVDPILDGLHETPSPGPILAGAERIGRYFDAASPAKIIARLSSPQAGDEAWAGRTRARLEACSPLALALTARAIRNARELDLRETLIQDYRLAWRLVEDGEFREGVRAALVDKDAAPRWRHASVKDVTEAEVDGFFASLGGDELVLPLREEMQRAKP